MHHLQCHIVENAQNIKNDQQNVRGIPQYGCEDEKHCQIASEKYGFRLGMGEIRNSTYVSTHLGHICFISKSQPSHGHGYWIYRLSELRFQQIRQVVFHFATN